MAYVFQNLNSALNDDDEQQQSQSNIFDPTAGQVGQGMADQQPGAQKTTTEGEIQGGGGSGGVQTSEGKPAEQMATGNAALAKNKPKTMPKFAEQAKSEIETAGQNLQNEANQYVQGYASKDYSVGQGDLDKAISGDETAAGNVRSRLSGQAERAKGFDTTGDYDVDDIYRMQTDAGVDSLLRRESGPEYSNGEAAFDRMLLNRTPEFNLLRSSLKGQQEALTHQLDDYRTSKTDEAQKALDTNYGKAQEGIKSYLGGQSDSLMKAQEAERDAENAARAQLRSSGGDAAYRDAQQKAALEALRKQYTGQDPYGMLGYLDQAGVDPSQYYAVSGDLDTNAFIDEGEAKRFNSIMGLLGKGDSWSAGKGAGDRQGFNADAYQQAVIQSAQGKAEAAKAEAQRLADERAAKDAASLRAQQDSERNMAGALARADAGRSAREQAAAAAASEEEAQKQRELERTVRIGGQPVGVTNKNTKDVNWWDKERTGNTAADPLQTARKDYAKASSTAQATVDKTAKTVTSSGEKAKAGGKKIKKAFGG